MRPRQKLAPSLLSVSFLSACASLNTPVEVGLGIPFVVDQARQALQPGINTVRGSGFMRQQGGGTVTCAGSTVFLIPATAYATARMQAVYGNAQSGVRARAVKFSPDEPLYYELQKQTRCDAQGSFTFERVADGEFFLVTSVSWVVNYVQQGGYLMQRIRLQGGQTVTAVLAP